MLVTSSHSGWSGLVQLFAFQLIFVNFCSHTCYQPKLRWCQVDQHSNVVIRISSIFADNPINRRSRLCQDVWQRKLRNTPNWCVVVCRLDRDKPWTPCSTYASVAGRKPCWRWNKHFINILSRTTFLIFRLPPLIKHKLNLWNAVKTESIFLQKCFLYFRCTFRLIRNIFSSEVLTNVKLGKACYL